MSKLEPAHISHIARALLNRRLVEQGFDLAQRHRVGEKFLDVVVEDNPYDYNVMVRFTFDFSEGPARVIEVNIVQSQYTHRGITNSGRATLVLQTALEYIDPLLWITLAA